MANLLVLHGPNLNLLGSREPEHYGHYTLAEINQQLLSRAQQLGHTLSIHQSHDEAELITLIQQTLHEPMDFLLFNPASFTHTSLALRDALLAVKLPFIEIHLSNPHTREAFRHHSYFSDIALGVISGFQSHSYYLALEACHQYLLKK
jgi:3-dehydroquinate dehydratase II